MRVLIFWIVFAILTSACLSIIAADTKYGNVLDADCAFGEWSAWQGCETSDCSALATRTRTITQQSSGAGAPCIGSSNLIETNTCDVLLSMTCGVAACQYSEWSNWSSCPDICITNANDCSEVGTRVRTRTVLRPAMPGGTPCDWSSLVQTELCPIAGFCPGGQQCIPFFASDMSQCNACPQIGCTSSERPFWTMCTARNINGSDTDCNPFQLLYSRTCDYPECTNQCKDNNYAYFTRCSQPCGPGTFVSYTGTQCPNISISTCTLTSCNTGAMRPIPVTVRTNDDIFADPFLGETTCTAADTALNQLSRTRCLAQCASSPTCNYAWQSQPFGNVTFSNLPPLVTSSPINLFSYSNLSTECIVPNWDMAAAACLYVCDNASSRFGLTSHLKGAAIDPTRGLVFPFSDGSTSCPIKNNILEQVCPNTTRTLTSFSGVGNAPYLMQNYDPTAQNNPRKVLGNVTYTCPASTDCVYQNWQDAQPWGLCSQSPYSLDTGIRTRIRKVVKEPTFLGEPCDIQDMTAQAICNRSLTLNSASDMMCTTTSEIVSENVSEYYCHQICMQMRTQMDKDACNSFMVFEQPPKNIPEVFLVSFSTTFTTLTAAAAPLQSGFRLAYRDEIIAAWSSGFQSCLAGWALTSPTIPNLQLLAAVQQNGCAPIGGQALAPTSLSSLNLINTSNNVWAYGFKALYTQTTEKTLLFFSATTASSIFDSTYFFKAQSFSSEVSCAFFADRIDRLLNDEQCTSLTLPFTNSLLFDVPYSLADNCSTTTWTSYSSCGQNCVFDLIETRAVVAPPSQGGRPCSQTPLQRSTACLPPIYCSESYNDVCIPIPLRTRTNVDYSTACTLSAFPSDVYLEMFASTTVLQWAMLATSLSEISRTEFFSSTIRQNYNQAPLPAALIDAINSQCVFGCYNVDSTIFSLTSKGYGWDTNTGATQCAPYSAAVQQCLQQRLPNPIPGKQYYNIAANKWECPSTCRLNGLSLSCSISTGPIPQCPCLHSWQTSPVPQTINIPFQSISNFYNCNLGNPQYAWTWACTATDTVPCANDNVCPIGDDGSQCNSVSGSGTCNVQAATCTCLNPAGTNFVKENCNWLCPLGSNGVPCTTNLASCSFGGNSFTCICPPGRSGVACQSAGVGMLNLVESLLYTATSTLQGTDQSVNVFTFTNPEPRCEDNPSFCAGSQAFSPLPIVYPFYEFTNWLPFANICVNTMDSVFDAQWVGSKFLHKFLIQPETLLPTSCESYYETQNLQTVFPFTLTAKFRSVSAVPRSLQGKQFFTRCPTPSKIGTGTVTYAQLVLAQTASNGDILFDIIRGTGNANGLSSLASICSNFST